MSNRNCSIGKSTNTGTGTFNIAHPHIKIFSTKITMPTKKWHNRPLNIQYDNIMCPIVIELYRARPKENTQHKERLGSCYNEVKAIWDCESVSYIPWLRRNSLPRQRQLHPRQFQINLQSLGALPVPTPHDLLYERSKETEWNNTANLATRNANCSSVSGHQK